jgi:hypothetical protein
MMMRADTKFQDFEELIAQVELQAVHASLKTAVYRLGCNADEGMLSAAGLLRSFLRQPHASSSPSSIQETPFLLDFNGLEFILSPAPAGPPRVCPYPR